MLTKAERKFLTKALGECWHEINDDNYDGEDNLPCIKCGILCEWEWSQCLSGEIPMDVVPAHDTRVASNNRTFTSAQDYEDLLEKMVRPNLYDFEEWLFHHYYSLDRHGLEYMEWFLTLSIEERNKLVYDFCIYMYKQGHADFRWVKEFVGKEEV